MAMIDIRPGNGESQAGAEASGAFFGGIFTTDPDTLKVAWAKAEAEHGIGFTPHQQDWFDRGLLRQGIRKDQQAVVLNQQGDLISTAVTPTTHEINGARYTLFTPTDIGLLTLSTDQPKDSNVF